MDEIDCKLATNNAILISHAISKIVTTLKQKSEESHGDVSGIPEFTALLSHCESNDALISVSACHAMTKLVENGILGVGTTLSRFISLLGTTRNYTAVTAVISNLLVLGLRMYDEQTPYCCPFSLGAPQHPLITILNQNKNIWRDVVNQMLFMVNHWQKPISSNSIELLRPVFFYILCNPTSTLSESCKQQTWHILIKTDRAAVLRVETILWLQSSNANSCINTNYRVLELTELALLNRDKKLYNALTPLVASLALKLVQLGCDPRANLEILSTIIEENDNNADNITTTIIAELVLICPAPYLYNLVQLCAKIVSKKMCSATFAYAMSASLLQWMAYPSLLSSDALETAKDVINEIKNKQNWTSKSSKIYSNKLFNALRHFDSNTRFVTEACRCLETLTDDDTMSWLEHVSTGPSEFKYKLKLLLCGLFLQSESPAITMKLCDILVSIVRDNHSFASHLLPLVLYKLTNSEDCNQTKALLFNLPELAVVKENVPLIIYNLEMLLASGKPLKQLAIELYLKTWNNESRCHRYLQAALVDASNNDHTWEMNISCARAMKYICETRPEHGAELVPLLSQILNRCNDTLGSAPSALALKGISALCGSGVINISSTWKVLAPKLNKERRSIVLQSLCDLFGDIPSYPDRPSDNFDKLVDEVIHKLWNYISESECPRVVNAAFHALSAYNLDLIPLKSLPANFRKDLKLPDIYCKTPADAARKPELVLPYIPGDCWIQMLENVNVTALEAAGDLLISFIKTEIDGFHSSMYSPPQGEPMNFRYLPEKSVIRAIGDHIRRATVCPGQNTTPITMQCLRIFAHNFPKPLPPVNWVFLQGYRQVTDAAKKYALTIACHQLTISSSAKRFIENYLTEFEAVEQFAEYPLIYTNLRDLCKGVPPNILRPFLEKTLNYTLDKALMGNKESIEMCKQILDHYRITLKDETIHNANRTLLSILLEGVLDRIETDNELFEYFVAAALELSSKHIDRMTSPSVWWEVTLLQLRKAIIIRAELTLKRDVDSPFAWMNEVIDASVTMYGEHVNLLQTMINVHSKMRSEASSAKWTLELMGRIQAVLVDTSLNDTVRRATFLCDVLIVSIVCLSGYDCFLTNRQTLSLSRDIRINLFPQAIADLVQSESWRGKIAQIMEWLNHMRKSVMPELYTLSFHNALVSMKHERYFNDVWIKYLSHKPQLML